MRDLPFVDASTDAGLQAALFSVRRDWFAVSLKMVWQTAFLPVAGYSKDLAANDAAVRWIDEWMLKEGCEYRTASWVERGISRWTDHAFSLARGAGRTVP